MSLGPLLLRSGRPSILWTTAPAPTPSAAPAATSVGKCRPVASRDHATATANGTVITASAGVLRVAAVAYPKAPAVCDDGIELDDGEAPKALRTAGRRRPARPLTAKVVAEPTAHPAKPLNPDRRALGNSAIAAVRPIHRRPPPAAREQAAATVRTGPESGRRARTAAVSPARPTAGAAPTGSAPGLVVGSVDRF